ncbi:hypothetical protein L6452_30987 [Arctium lappa]|uniref:Uncharacterized protein n=1 Tax=Arctium lappa TaxID=4217 RepID=A0ACB8ZK15_ARCLA|nr:hypothetical protein L6452_30987 [Arctium lappa]
MGGLLRSLFMENMGSTLTHIMETSEEADIVEWQIYSERLLTLAGVYAFWKHVLKLDRLEICRYLEMFYALKFANWLNLYHSLLMKARAIASEFRPMTEFEKKMDSLINAKELSEAHKGDGARILELNKISVEDVKERQDRLAKMRNFLFRHELKSKRIKHIKSKTYRRLLKKDKSKAAATEIEMNPDAAKELAEKQEFKRAEERLTLKHKNTSKWAKHIKKCGFDVQDDGTRVAISEQLQQHALFICLSF